MQDDGAHDGADDGADGRMTAQMMAQTTARGMRLLAKPVAGGAPPCQASVNSGVGMRTETVNSAKKFDFEFQRKTKNEVTIHA